MSKVTEIELNGEVYDIGGMSAISQLEDVEIQDLTEKQILTYDIEKEKWTNTNAPGDTGIDVNADGEILEFMGGSRSAEVKFSDRGSDTTAIRFGIDEQGNYGYYKVGADTVTPFKTESGIAYLISTDDYKGQILKIYNAEGQIIKTPTFNEKGQIVVYFPEVGEYTLESNDGLTETIQVDYPTVGIGDSKPPEYFFSASKGNNRLYKLKTVFGQNCTKKLINISQEKIEVYGTSNYSYYSDYTPFVYWYCDVSNISTIKITWSRTSTSGRPYFGVSTTPIEELVKTHTSLGSIPGARSYPSDSTALNTYSLNVASVQGMAYVWMGNSADGDNITTITEWSWT